MSHWLTRQPNLEQIQRFQNLLDLHRLTLQWLKDLAHSESPLHSSAHGILARVRTQGNAATLEKLEQLVDRRLVAEDLDELMEDATIEETLDRLHSLLWTLHAWVFQGILDRTPETERAALGNQLERSSFDAGQEASRSRWSRQLDSPPFLLQELKAALDTTLFGRSQGFFVERQTRQELRIRWRSSAYFSEFPEVRNQAQWLHRLHVEWCHGYAYSLNPRVRIDSSPQTPFPLMVLRSPHENSLSP